ncbi:hypothetical protein FBUS_03064 [Fasciolopsis buskii]|uniref:Uncharacterized protein n=1 Tax=Fasciolopsis buskii TaxID=27845 RepID=A0A8E0RQ94_9TREM|nr:hypothetical protein FBUS_03064 [Fasciolopsis buski]
MRSEHESERMCARMISFSPRIARIRRCFCMRQHLGELEHVLVLRCLGGGPNSVWRGISVLDTGTEELGADEETRELRISSPVRRFGYAGIEDVFRAATSPVSDRLVPSSVSAEDHSDFLVAGDSFVQRNVPFISPSAEFSLSRDSTEPSPSASHFVPDRSSVFSSKFCFDLSPQASDDPSSVFSEGNYRDSVTTDFSPRLASDLPVSVPNQFGPVSASSVSFSSPVQESPIGILSGAGNSPFGKGSTSAIISDDRSPITRDSELKPNQFLGSVPKDNLSFLNNELQDVILETDVNHTDASVHPGEDRI